MKNSKSKTRLVPHPWSKEALFTKAQRYADEMLACERDEWKFAFWSSLSLEFLARAALSHIDQSLLAEPKDWNNLFYALGNTPKATKFIPKSIGIATIFSRLEEILADFDKRLEGFGVRHMALRNEELHSGSNPFDNLNNPDWLPIFYETAQVLAESIGEKLESLIGDDETDLAIKLIAAAKDQNAKAAAKSVAAHKTIWESKDSEEKLTLGSQAKVWATRQTGHRVKCPSCGSDALVAGSAQSSPKQKLKDEMIIETQIFSPSKFECVACGLKVSGLPHLHACGLGDTYKTTSTYDAADYYSAYDKYSEYEEDNNEP